MPERALSIPLPDGSAVSGVLHAPAARAKRSGVAVVLGHGAGGDMHAQLLVDVARGLKDRGHTALRFNFPYKELGRRAPDRPEKLEMAYEAAIARLRKDKPQRLLIGGKSMGGRIASLLAARGVPCDGLVFLGYPLHPAGKRAPLRDKHLSAIEAPMLFLQGTRDPLCSLDLLRPVLKRLGARASLHVVEGGDHSLELLKSAGRTADSVLAEILAAIDAWLAKQAPGKRDEPRPPEAGRAPRKRAAGRRPAAPRAARRQP
ncbi:alpha/beta family hydrolase [Sorangium sp. So ce296]|uniref:alpha/beta hydrolase family protein n=1 Tax=Sorangium sp. So ce296 TaxID=3133296 RepID=UPI003F5E6A75